MLTAYQSIFEGIPYITTVLAGIIMLSLIVQKNSCIARSILFSFGFWLAPLFYITYIALGHQTSSEIVAALFVECIILITYYALFSFLLATVSNTESLNIDRLIRWLKFGTAIVIGLHLPLVFSGGFGIFSSGPRNEYLGNSRWYLYCAYASLLTQAIIVPIIAAILNHEKQWNKLVVVYLAIVSSLSILTGSKGGGILSIFAILSLLRFQTTKDYVRLLRFPFMAIIAFLSATIYIVGNFLSLEPSQMISLMFARIYINNDARALAIDLGDPRNGSLFRESFRSLSTLFGYPPDYPALGQNLYTQAFHTNGFIGANSSATALLIAYGSTVERVLFSFLLCTIAASVYLFARGRNSYSIVKLAIGINVLSMLSQDFLAFQLIGNLLILSTVLLIMGMLGRRLLLVASNHNLIV